MNDKEVDNMLRDACSKLMEHGDAVQIHFTILSEGATTIHHIGLGNFFARIGMAKHFLDIDQAKDSAYLIGKQIAPPEDNGESWKESQ